MMSKWKNRWKVTVLRFAHSATAYQPLFCQLEPLENLAFVFLSKSNVDGGHFAFKAQGPFLHCPV